MGLGAAITPGRSRRPPGHSLRPFARVPRPAAQAQADYPQARLYADYQEMLAREDLDTVDVVLPSDLHYEVARAVLESGRHLLLEKPMALNLGHCSELIELARARSCLLAVGHELRMSSLWGKVKELIDAGVIGRPIYALVELWRRPYRLGSGGWRYDINRVGNWVLEEPIHFFDLARWYFSAVGDPVSVYAAANGKRPDHPELHDNFSALVTFPQGCYALISQTLAGWEHHQTAKLTGTEGRCGPAGAAPWIARSSQPFRCNCSSGDKVVNVPIAKHSGEVYEFVDEVGAVRAGDSRGNSAPLQRRRRSLVGGDVPESAAIVGTRPADLFLRNLSRLCTRPLRHPLRRSFALVRRE